jgi:hypothetical protein
VKYMVIPIRDVQAGDVIFTNDGDAKGVQLCARVLGLNVPSSDPALTELRVLMMGPKEEGSAIVGLRPQTPVGVAREDEFVDVDVAAILADW